MEYGIKINLVSKRYGREEKFPPIILPLNLVLDALGNDREYYNDDAEMMSSIISKLHCSKDDTSGDTAELIVLRTKDEIFREPMLFDEEGGIVARYTHDEVTSIGDAAHRFAERYKYSYLEYASDYGEPGYSMGYGKRGIFFSNRNNWSNLAQALLEREYELEWGDEWVVLHEEGGKAYRTSADSYGWQSSIVLIGCEYYSWDWVLRNERDLLLDEYLNSPKKAITSPDTKLVEATLTELGFARSNEDSYENGWHPGQTDEPEEILKMLNANGQDVIFVLDDVGQFDLSFSAWVRPVQIEVTEEEEIYV